jgi:hypothetical protein
MLFTQVYDDVRERIAAAPTGKAGALGLELTAELVGDPEAAATATADLDDDGQAAFAEIATVLPSAGAEELRVLLGRIDDGTEADGDMGPELIAALEALEAWTGFRESGDPARIAEIAVTALEHADWLGSGPVVTDDFLRTPEVAAVYERIKAATR